MRLLIIILFTNLNLICWSQAGAIETEHSDAISIKITELAKKYEQDIIQWRRHLHENPELSNREYNTMRYIYSVIKDWGIKVDTGMAHTGVVAVLDTKKPGPTMGLRADIDALPVTERVKIPFASKVKTLYQGQEVGVMHACGHDAHTAILMGTMRVLIDIKDQLKGKVVFVFQPAEEGTPPGEEGGAALMIKQGLLTKYGIEVIYGLHMNSLLDVGKITYKPQGMMAAADIFTIKVKGKQTHGSRPWDGIDPITVASQIILGLQTIVSRQVDLTHEAAVITIGKISGGVRFNIIPEEVEMEGTIRTLDNDMQNDIHQRIIRTATHIAESAGATVEVDIQKTYPVTYNNPQLTAQMLPTLEKIAGEENVRVIKPVTLAEDFSFYAQEIPGLFFFLGGKPLDVHTIDAPPHHTPDFYIDESGFVLGVRTLAQLVIDTKIKTN